MTYKTTERCPACVLLEQRHKVKRLYPIATDEGAARWRYECSRGHEFDGEAFKYDGDEEDCDDDAGGAS